MKLKRVGVVSAMKVAGILYSCLGVLYGGMFFIIGLIGGAATEGEALPAMFFGFGAIIVFPIMFGVIGVIGGAIVSFLYNMLASLVGGLELEFDGIQSSRAFD